MSANSIIDALGLTPGFCLISAIIVFLIIFALIISIHSRKNFQRIAFRDELTDLPTPAKLYRDMKKILSTAVTGEYMVISLDINNFRYIIDSFSPSVGNAVLIRLAEHFKKTFRQEDIISRVYIDNFAVFGKAECLANIEDMLMELENVTECLSDLLPSQYQMVFSSGVYYIDDISIPPSLMIERANTARILGKKSINCQRINEYTKKMQKDIQFEQEITFTMEQAFNNKEFIVYYQPKFSFTNGQIIGAEALIRWNNPKNGLLSPGEFVPLFERNGFIQRIDTFVFENVCQFLDEWNHSGPEGTCPKPLTISCNLSRIHLYNPNLASDLKKITSKYDIKPSKIELELTESIMFENHKHLLQSMNELKSAGFNISVDDFGSGYSSLNFLKDMPADVLKLDKEFLSSATDDKRKSIIIMSVINMAKELHLETVAEGIENEQQSELLKSMGCDIVQGFFFAHPMPEKDFSDKLKSGISPQT